METLKDLVAECRDASGTVIETPTRTAPYTYDDFVPNAWKSGNLLGHYGVHPGAPVTVVAGPKDADASETGRRVDAADPLLAAIGATLVGATVELEPQEPVDSRALVLPAGWTERYDLTPQCTQIAYGGPPEEADVVHFEQEMWSENPIEPPERVAPDDSAVVDSDEEYSHADLLSVATDLLEEHGLDAESTVVLDTPVVEPGAFVPFLAALAAEATLELAQVDSGSIEGDLVVSEDPAGENEVSVSGLTARLRDTRRA
ncbi:hypothetical protein GRX03_07220 [Halovenus sp. WSH3]|uniref:Uncharacterized protein n=1 Tax=Halovenus carboxidivorans TaxID=2692199 RepID=A0A6B0T7W3_9EURY|nr:hypothetical protein [Halovenus carboxidivorans]MXR51392.1 hypothetical protein [Halovenus carboxidivorans]